MSWLLVPLVAVVVLVAPLVPAVPAAAWFWYWEHRVDDLPEWREDAVVVVGALLALAGYGLAAWYLGFAMNWTNVGCPPFTC